MFLLRPLILISFCVLLFSTAACLEPSEDCPAGFKGTHCETDIDDCASVTCQNGGTCVDGVASSTCECANGYEGTNCETDIDDCASVICQNGGTCVDGVASYTCECANGYEGVHCETNINDCASVTCQNGGTCTDGVASYTCECAVGYEGMHCETNINECANAPCQNAGTCVDGIASYTCNCVTGYEGTNCETNIDDCGDVTCQNGGTCIDGVTSYTCECANGYEGTHCETERCGNGGKTGVEQCDDSNTTDGDGCSASCTIEWGFLCNETEGNSSCASLCGDGLKASDEACDDGNPTDDDGCSATCTVETPVTFNCATAVHDAQVAAAPDYWYAQEHDGVAPNSDRQPIRMTWEPLLEEVPGCNGLPWTADGVERELKAFNFLVVLDASWVSYYETHQAHFATQGYPTLETSPGILFDRVSYLYEAQFRVRIGISRVEAFPDLLEKCATNNNHVENGDEDATNSWVALADRGVSMLPSEAGILRLGVGSESVYCHSSAPLNSICNNAMMTNQQKPFSGDDGRISHQAARTLAHEMGHFFGICGDSAHPHCLNAHLANEIPDLMVWNGMPAEAVRSFGMFYKFLPSCTPVYDLLLCENVKAASATCGVPVTCDNAGLDCSTAYWSTAGSRASLANDGIQKEVRPRSDQLAVRCCNDEDPGTCESDGLGGLQTVGSDTGCSGLMTWPEADRFCRQAGRRLCTLGELEAKSLCLNTGCAYETERVWTSSPDVAGAHLVGRFKRLPVENGWHDVTVSLIGGVLVWTNAANASWELLWVGSQLWTPADSPYGENEITLEYDTDANGANLPGVTRIHFFGETYHRQ